MTKPISLAEAKARKAAKEAAAPSQNTVIRNRTEIENLRLLSRNLDRIHSSMSASIQNPSMIEALREEREWLMKNIDKM